MYNHAPKDYKCPLCLIIKGEDNPGVFAKSSDVFYKDEFVTGFIGHKRWPKNPVGTIIIPNEHFENLYDLSEEYGHKIFDFSKKLAVALKEIYKCDGISTRQHNEPAGSQDVWHYHLHVTPRFQNDDLYIRHKESTLLSPEERAKHALKIKKYFDQLRV